MRNAIVLGGRFRVFEDGRINRIKNGIEEPANMFQTGKDGKYLAVTYTSNKKQYRVYVHRIVAMTFVPNPNNLSDVNHIDGDTRNNSCNNLEWVTPKENVNHAIRTGLINKAATAEQCVVCGKWTLSKDNVCPACSQKINREAKKIDRIAERSDRFGSIDLEKCTGRQAEYVACAMLGLTSSEIARKYDVSKQCVNEALHAAEMVDSRPIKKAVQNQVVSILRRIERNKLKMNEAKSSYDLAKLNLNNAEDELFQIAKLNGVSVDDLIREGAKF